MTIEIPFTLLDPYIEAPRYAYPGDAAIDLRSTIDVVLEPGARATIPCGIAVAIPRGYAGFVLPRSGLALKHGISLVNAPGLIDSGYRGELCVILINLDNSEPFILQRGDRIAQLLVLAVPEISLISCASLDDTERSCEGFGSSGRL